MYHLDSIFVRQRGRLGVVALLVACVLAAPTGCGGCGDEEMPKEQQKAAEVKKDASAETSEGRMGRLRRAYGLPLPPSVTGVYREGHKVRVQTDMSLEEVTAFFRARLTDYEVFELVREVRAVGLRDYMPDVYAYRVGSQTYLIYQEGFEAAAEAEQKADDKLADPKKSDDDRAHGSGASSRARSSEIVDYKKGQPVLERTPDGELLAPGARWGEPYTPPPGSPLDRRNLRQNFGKPYGEWVLF